MATFAARRLQAMLSNTAHIIAIELLAAAQGLEFSRPLTSSAALEALYQWIRGISAAMIEDRSLAGDMQQLQQLVLSGALLDAMEPVVPPLARLRLD